MLDKCQKFTIDTHTHTHTHTRVRGVLRLQSSISEYFIRQKSSIDSSCLTSRHKKRLDLLKLRKSV